MEWTSSNSSVASVSKDGVVTALGSGTSVITAKNSRDDVKSTCKISVVDKPIEFSGTGDRVINNVNIPTGCYRARINNTGSSNFVVKHYETATDKYPDLLVNEIGSYSGVVLLREGSIMATTGGMFEISSSGNWTISIEKITDTQSGSYIEGTGDSVTGWISGDGKRHPGLFVHTGSSNFAVWIHDASGERDLLVNEIGAYSGQAVMALKSGGKYFLEVTADGPWTISWD